MKNIKYIIAAVCIALFTACQDKGEWDVPATADGNSGYGNNSLTETNVMSIKSLISKYAAVALSDADMVEITEDIQIKGRVTANDVGGNYYKKITIQDEPADMKDSRAMTISIDEAGLWSYLPIGQEILVSLKGLYIGGYGKQPQIGTPYTSDKGKTSVGRMSKHLWQQHFKRLGTELREIQPVEFDKAAFDASYKSGDDTYAAMLVKFTNVTFKTADGKETLKSGPEAALKGYYQTWLDDDKKYGDNVIIFTSGDYAKFSSMVLPYDTENMKKIPCDLVGIASFYNTKGGVWQISIRKTDDITVPSKGGSTDEGGTDEGGTDEGGSDAAADLTKTVAEHVVTFTNDAATASGNTIIADFNEQGWSNEQDITSEKVTLSDGTTIEFDKGENKTTPKFYTATKGIRIYAKNSIIIKASKPIAKAVLTCDTYKTNGNFCTGNDMMFARQDGNTLTICNDFTQASGGTQLRLQTIELTYAE